jgi:hypothetical protein
VLILLPAILFVCACWAGLSFWGRLRVLQMEIDLLMGELHKLQTEAATRSSQRSTRDDRTSVRAAYAER